MSEIIVLYTSKYGSSKQCAEWLASELNADLFQSSSQEVINWEKYSVIVYCGGIYAGSINGIKILAKNHAALMGKKIAVVACGLSDPNDSKVFEQYRNGLFKDLPQGLHGNTKFFLVRGGITYSNLKLADKAMIKMLEKVLRKKKQETLKDEERKMLEVLGKDTGFSLDRTLIQPIIDYCKF